MQCSQHNRKCDWPEQLKRLVLADSLTCYLEISFKFSGPAKGYIEVLENRLHETENALLMVLSRISDEQFLGDSTPDQSGYSLPRQERKGTEYWKEFPLDTAHNIRKWQYDNQENGPFESSNEEQDSRQSSTQRTVDAHPMVGPPDTNILGTNHGANIRRDTSEMESDSDINRKAALIDAHNTPRPVWNMPPTFPAQRVSGESSRPTTPISHQKAPFSGFNEQATALNIPQEPSQWTEAPSVKFQEQFLW
ncbi:uncharacterized protein LDX57_005740 [Aspergillus melleus]|uniref:uncharacterized protein n=1 Tax=Aspergillus melleus TaxID=138277 RepID=UPI001E8DB35A|nr:uncharacterized protein LDX57_005740 [Aspergillus melleus]KAH8428035.1 hypothetical protein LDX57_005740 [Aspergillus melleus]